MRELIDDIKGQIEITYEDVGIGPYDYCGAKGVHISYEFEIEQGTAVVEIEQGESIPTELRFIFSEGFAACDLVAKLVKYESGKATYEVEFDK